MRTPPTIESVQDAALRYIRRGWCVLPLPLGEKIIHNRGWTSLRLDEDDIGTAFAEPRNIGIILGEPSGWLVDVDLDCAEALRMADEHLPPTEAVSGRCLRPGSHRWYVCTGAKTRQFRDPRDNTMIVELRSTGAQTVVGPSLHPDGDVYEALDGEPAEVAYEELLAAVERINAAVLKERGVEPRERPARHPPTITGPDVSPEDRVRRASAYLRAMPPAISGQGGHGRTYAAATSLVHGFCLDADAALRMLIDEYNPRCEPPWSEKELSHKVEDAATRPHERPRGWLLGDPARVESFPQRDAVHSQIQKETRVTNDPGPFPEALLRVPGMIGDVIEYNLATAPRPQPVLALAGALALQAVLSGRKVRDELGNHTNLYFVSMAGSGLGKDHARKINKRVLHAAGCDHLEGPEDLASDSGLYSALEIRPAQLIQLDEFGRFLRTIGSPRQSPHLYGVLSAMMKLYSSADGVYHGKAYADASKNRSIDRPCLVLHGTTVYEHFYKALSGESFADGFIPRMLIFEAAERPPRNRRPLYDVPGAIVEAAGWWDRYVPAGPAESARCATATVETSEEAYDRFEDLTLLAETEADTGGASAAAVWARAEEKACRLALLYACSADREHPRIDRDAADWACRLVRYLTERLLFVADGWVADSAFEATQKRIVRCLEAEGGTLTRSQLTRKTQWLTPQERDNAIANLADADRVEIILSSTNGRPGTKYVLRPA